MRGSRSAGKGLMSRATSMYRMSLVNRSWFSRVTPWDSCRAVGMEDASLGMSEMARVGTQDRASALSGVSYITVTSVTYTYTAAVRLRTCQTHNTGS